MTPKEFFVCTAKMRQAQNKYFALPKGHPDKQKWLKESKRIEKIVDDEIKRVVAKKEPSELAAACSRFDPMYSSDLQLQLL